MRFITLLFFLVFCSLSFSQVNIFGDIKDHNNNIIEFSEIILLDKDSLVIATQVTETDGSFSINVQTGSYIFMVRRFNEIIYNKFIDAFEDLNLKDIKTNSSINLEEIIIESEKKILSRKADRLIYYISNDALNKGSNLLEALHRAPRVSVDNDNVNIIGKDGITKFLINGRLQNLSQEAIKAKLKGLNVEQIERIEVIPTPPAKYAAEGSGGMINIILKKDENTGFQGGVNSGVGFRFNKTSPDEAFNMNYNTKKLDATINLNYDIYNGTNINRSKYEFDSKTTTVENLPDFSTKSFLISTILLYKITPKFNLGTSFDYNNDNDKNNTHSSTNYYNKLLFQNDSLMYSENINSGSSKSEVISSFADYTFDNLGKKISFIYNYSHNRIVNNANNVSNVYVKNNTNHSSYSNNSNNGYKINGLHLDIELPFTFGTIEVGGAYTYINNNTSIVYYDEKNLQDLNKSNKFKYTERISATYASIHKTLIDRLSVKLGVRLEETKHKGYSPTILTTNSNYYTKLFPTLFIGYRLNDNNYLALSYSKRLERPSFYDLNPFRYYTDIYSYESGNPYLLPSYTNSLEISYAFKNNLNIIAYGTYKEDAITYLTNIQENKYYSTTPFNNFNQKKGGLIINYSVKPFKINTIYSNFNIYYSSLNSNKAVKSTSGFGGHFTIRSTYELNKQKTSLLELNYRQTLPSQNGFLDYKSKTSGTFNITFKQMLLDNNLVLSCSLSDIFRQNIIKIEKRYDMFNYSQYNDIHNRGVYFSLSYIFGKKNVNEIYKDTKNENINRGNK